MDFGICYELVEEEKLTFLRFSASCGVLKSVIEPKEIYLLEKWILVI